ncbi:MAG: hypothetical protein J1F12_07260 [Muribaculaceae bacterium]|nr:hypothetical protein [Muribaculaceae bacterium]
MKRKHLIYGIVTTLFAGAFSSCKEDTYLGNDLIEEGGVLQVNAELKKPASTRGYIESGKIEEGIFTLTYPYYYANINVGEGTFRFNYAFGQVSFQGSTGFAYNVTSDGPVELRWAEKSSGANNGVYVRPNYYDNTATLFMDNVLYGTGASGTGGALSPRDTIISLPEDNPYIAAKFDDEEGTNDLLWGKGTAKLNSRWIMMEMHHYMSRVKVNVTVKKREGQMNIDLRNAKVKITNVLQVPKSYNRKTGELYFIGQTAGKLNESETIQPEQYQDFQMVYRQNEVEEGESPENPETRVDETATLVENYWWEKPIKNYVEPDEEDEEKMIEYEVYSTYDFVFPPQTLQTDDKRPRLVITVPAKDYNDGASEYGKEGDIEFSGYLPRSMFVKGEGEQEMVPERLNFLKEYALTINTSLEPGEPELEFMPVTVEPWVDKGHLAPKSNQAGIGSAADFYKMIEYYKANNTFQLGRYGYIMDEKTNKWRFQFRATNVELELEKIQGEMKPGTHTENGVTPPFEIDVRNRVELVVLPDGSKYELETKNGANEGLYELLTTDPIGVVQTEESSPEKNNFSELIEAYESKARKALRLAIFGEYDKDEKKWIFKISDDIILDYKDIVGKMPAGELHPYRMYLDTNKVTVKNYPGEEGPKVLELEDEDGATELYNILTYQTHVTDQP